jgi:hypothetical protein
MMGWYLDQILKIGYREDQKNLKQVLYTDPTDLFLNGVMETRQGTCGNLALLWVVLGRRLGWPISLATVGAHFIGRFDDGKKVINIEAASESGQGGFRALPDSHYLGERKMPRRAVDCGSDLHSLTPREMLGVFFGARARHYNNLVRHKEAEPDYLVARYLFPHNRFLYISQNQISVQNSMDLFEPGERGHPIELAAWLREVVQKAPWLNANRGVRATPQPFMISTRPSGTTPPKPQENRNVHVVDAVIQAMGRKAK